MIIGIDLGTNNICMSYFLNNELKLITDNQGNSFIKSLIAINDSMSFNIRTRFILDGTLTKNLLFMLHL